MRVVGSAREWYLLVLVTASVLAVVWSRLWYALLLGEVVAQARTLRSVLRAIWEPRKQIVVLLALFCGLVYFFSVGGYLFFRAAFPIQCSRFSDCWAIVLDQSFQGGLAAYLQTNTQPQDQAYSDDRLDGALVVFQILFHIAVVVLVLQMLGGVIIDTFSKLREEADLRQQDDSARCFLCGLAREQLERDAEDAQAFQRHTEGLHSPWNYLFFLAYLRASPPAF